MCIRDSLSGEMLAKREVCWRDDGKGLGDGAQSDRHHQVDGFDEACSLNVDDSFSLHSSQLESQRHVWKKLRARCWFCATLLEPHLCDLQSGRRVAAATAEVGIQTSSLTTTRPMVCE